ncbi:T-complex protein eta subunit [Mycena chlorophos]|uniref:CCT-eta n=1 Tax=Mycena chlorophos TaxID=658473 RepID=A0A8H6T7D1_MYCCL|nr:T-complex protein eta subunit [Mycena chlorophos]
MQRGLPMVNPPLTATYCRTPTGGHRYIAGKPATALQHLSMSGYRQHAEHTGPRGMDKLIVNERGEAQITNDGATILKLLDIVHPAARTLVDIARAQDAEVGDGTTSVVLLAAQLLKEVRAYIEEGVSPHIIMKGFRLASQLATDRIKEIQITVDKSDPEKFRSLLLKCASTSMSSKLIHSEKPFFSNMVVDAVQCLDQDDLDESLIGGVAFKKTFTYAGAEQQPRYFRNPLILCLNVELELKAEKDNAKVRVEAVADYQAIFNAEWEIIYRKLQAIEKTGAKVVLSKLPIGDLATQWFADRDIFCAGRVVGGDLRRVVQATGGDIQSTCTDIKREHLGTCGSFEEKQIGGERYNLFQDCPKSKTCTLVLRGGAEQFIEEVERSLHDAIMVVKRAVKNGDVVAGGGAIEMDLSGHIRKHALSIPGKQQLIITAFAKALEIIPRQICDNAGLDSTDILNKLRMKHATGERVVTDKMRERAAHERELKEKQDESEDDDLEVVDGDEDLGPPMVEEAPSKKKNKGKGKAVDSEPEPAPVAGSKRRRPAIDPFAASGFGDNEPTPASKRISLKAKGHAGIHRTMETVDNLDVGPPTHQTEASVVAAPIPSTFLEAPNAESDDPPPPLPSSSAASWDHTVEQFFSVGGRLSHFLLYTSTP